MKERFALPELPSVRDASLMLRLGAGSSSVMVTVTCWLPLSVAPLPPVTPVMSRMKVSLSSSKVSWAAVTVVVPVS